MKALDKRQVQVLYLNHLQAKSLSGWLCICICIWLTLYLYFFKPPAGRVTIWLTWRGLSGRRRRWWRRGGQGGKLGKGSVILFTFFNIGIITMVMVIITIITCDGGSEENPEDDEYPSVGAKAVLAVCFEPNRTEKFGLEVGWYNKFKSSEWNLETLDSNADSSDSG